MRTSTLLLLLVLSCFGADDKILLRISTENRATHIQTKIVSEFADSVNKELGDKIEAKHFFNGELFKDSVVVGALGRDQIEMAVPGNWQLDKYEPHVGVFLLPSFYGLGLRENYKIRDGEIGKKINEALEKKTSTVVLGRWIDLGFANIYTFEKEIKTHNDFKGLRIRVAGGLANIERLRALGAYAVSIPWSDLDSAIAQGKIDGILTTHETVASAKLWEKGIKYCFEDRSYFPQYIPLVSEKFFRRIGTDLQNRLKALWEKQVDSAREKAKRAQEEAREILIKQGVKITTPQEGEIAKTRTLIRLNEETLIRQLGLNSAFVKEIESGAE